MGVPLQLTAATGNVEDGKAATFTVICSVVGALHRLLYVTV
jgi:hypothetical protein